MDPKKIVCTQRHIYHKACYERSEFGTGVLKNSKWVAVAKGDVCPRCSFRIIDGGDNHTTGRTRWHRKCWDAEVEEERRRMIIAEAKKNVCGMHGRSS